MFPASFRWLATPWHRWRKLGAILFFKFFVVSFARHLWFDLTFVLHRLLLLRFGSYSSESNWRARHYAWIVKQAIIVGAKTFRKWRGEESSFRPCCQVEVEGNEQKLCSSMKIEWGWRSLSSCQSRLRGPMNDQSFYIDHPVCAVVEVLCLSRRWLVRYERQWNKNMRRWLDWWMIGQCGSAWFRAIFPAIQCPRILLDWTSLMSLRAEYIILLSFLLTFTVVSNAFYTKKQFYPSVVYLTKSSSSLAVRSFVDG